MPRANVAVSLQILSALATTAHCAHARLCSCSFPRGQVVVCAFHRPVKLDPDSLTIWAQIILSHPTAVLWMISYEDYALHNLMRELDRRSLSGRCVSFCMRASSALEVGSNTCDPMQVRDLSKAAARRAVYRQNTLRSFSRCTYLRGAWHSS